ncbi:ATPase [Trypanosoma cruzi]|uniref:ATPase n=1 Tax=Trypanosoma cruzi TaxID=5693 RepID=A0A7J6XMJ0_TRYCR|nr:ATPase [Trypanosoma cruzi]
MCVKFFTFLFLLFFFHLSLPHSFSFFLLLGAITMDVFSTLPSLIVSCCTLPVRGAVCFPPNCSTRTPTDTLMTTALCASPAARMRRGRDERRAEGAVTCGRATRACGAEHTFLSLLFCFLCGQGEQTPAAPHTQPHPAAVFFFSVDGCVLLIPCGDGGRRAVPDALPTYLCASSVNSLLNGCLLHTVMGDLFLLFVFFLLPTRGAGPAAVRPMDCTKRGFEEQAGCRMKCGGCCVGWWNSKVLY